jgi:hypothetical protein
MVKVLYLGVHVPGLYGLTGHFHAATRAIYFIGGRREAGFVDTLRSSNVYRLDLPPLPSVSNSSSSSPTAPTQASPRWAVAFATRCADSGSPFCLGLFHHAAALAGDRIYVFGGNPFQHFINNVCHSKLLLVFDIICGVWLNTRSFTYTPDLRRRVSHTVTLVPAMAAVSGHGNGGSDSHTSSTTPLPSATTAAAASATTTTTTTTITTITTTTTITTITTTTKITMSATTTVAVVESTSVGTPTDASSTTSNNASLQATITTTATTTTTTTSSSVTGPAPAAAYFDPLAFRLVIIGGYAGVVMDDVRIYALPVSFCSRYLSIGDCLLDRLCAWNTSSNRCVNAPLHSAAGGGDASGNSSGGGDSESGDSGAAGLLPSTSCAATISCADITQRTLSADICELCASTPGCHFCPASNRCEANTTSCMGVAEPEGCLSCRDYFSCYDCLEKPGCEYQGQMTCVPASSASTSNRISDLALCDSTVSSYSVCRGLACTACSARINCAWCASENLCLPAIAFTSEFSYGQCLRYAPDFCADNPCAGMTTCETCLANSRCGWCGLDTTATLSGQPQGVCTPGTPLGPGLYHPNATSTCARTDPNALFAGPDSVLAASTTAAAAATTTTSTTITTVGTVGTDSTVGTGSTATPPLTTTTTTTTTTTASNASMNAATVWSYFYCPDVDECAVGQDACCANATCVNLDNRFNPTGYRCDCPDNYTRSASGLCCDAVCPLGCVHGDCVLPGVCVCWLGYSGSTCADMCCNGHSVCIANGTSEAFACDCEENIEGPQCEVCKPRFYGNATAGGACRSCQDICNAHTSSCRVELNASSINYPTYTHPNGSNFDSRNYIARPVLDNHGSGGVVVCEECGDHTFGPYCERCASGFFLSSGIQS